jgi:hypothetical protein
MRLLLDNALSAIFYRKAVTSQSPRLRALALPWDPIVPSSQPGTGCATEVFCINRYIRFDATPVGVELSDAGLPRVAAKRGNPGLWDGTASR